MANWKRLACGRVLPIVPWKVDGSDDWMVSTMVAMKDPLMVGQKALLKCLACGRVLPMVSRKAHYLDD